MQSSSPSPTLTRSIGAPGEGRRHQRCVNRTAFCRSWSLLGFHISVYRIEGEPPKIDVLLNGRSNQSVIDELERGDRIAVWQTGLSGIHWVKELRAQGRAHGDLGTGYPGVFLARAADVLQTILDGPPDAHKTWVHGPTDIIGPAWEGRTVINHDAAAACEPHEWLLFIVWDES